MRAGAALIFWFLPLVAGAQGGGSISGRVTNSVTGAGIEGALVTACVSLEACFQGESHEAATDAAGGFRIAGVSDAQYLIDLAAPGFVPAPGGLGGGIRVSGDTRLDLQMTPFAGVSGRVLDPEGKPAAGVMVKIDPSGCGDCRPLDMKETDEDGTFEFDHLFPGLALTLSATPKRQAADAASGKDEERMVTTYYPSVMDIEQATAIRLEGRDLTGYDIRMQTALGHVVRGTVIGVDGKPARAAMVSVVKPVAGMIAMIRGAGLVMPKEVSGAEPGETKSDGLFLFPPVREGDWRVRAVQRVDDGLAGGSGMVDVALSKADIDDLEIRLTPSFVVEVTADWGDTPPAKVPAGFATIAALDGAQPLPPIPADLTPGQTLRVERYAGRYLIAPGGAATPGFYTAAAMMEGRDVLGQVVELTGATAVKMIFKTGGGSVRGTVERGAGAMVVLMADATASSWFGYSGRCDANGTFFIPDLPPGAYTAVAVQGPPGDPRRPEFASMLASSGKRVKVEAGSAASMELRVAGQ